MEFVGRGDTTFRHRHIRKHGGISKRCVNKRREFYCHIITHIEYKVKYVKQRTKGESLEC